MNEGMAQDSIIVEDWENEGGAKGATRSVTLGLTIFSIYVVTFAASAIDAGVGNELNDAALGVGVISAILSLLRFTLTFDGFLRADLCSFLVGGTGELVISFLVFLMWGSTTLVITFRIDSPFAVVSTGYFSAWACVILSSSYFAINAVKYFQVGEEVADTNTYGQSLLVLVGIFSIVAIIQGAVNCGVLCSNGSTVFAFITSISSIIIVVLMTLVLRKQLTLGVSEENSFVVLGITLVMVWTLGIMITTYGIPFSLLTANGFFASWGGYIASCAILTNAHERFAEGETRSNLERRSLLFILTTSTAIIMVSGAVTCNLGACSGFTIYAIIMAAFQVLAIFAAFKFFWEEGEAREKYLGLGLSIIGVANIFILTFPTDSEFAFAQSGYFAVIATCIFAFGYLNQLNSLEAENLLGKCMGSGGQVDEKHARLRRKVYVAGLVLAVNFVSAIFQCIDACGDNQIFALVVGGISYLVLLGIFFLSDHEGIVQALEVLLALIWLIAVPYMTLVGPFVSNSNGFFSSWAALGVAIWMLI